jgi:imidazolonepropionase-like amidohydrolase
MSTARRAAAPIVAIAALVALSPGSAAADEPKPAALALEHVTVLPMTRAGAPLRDVTVLVREGRIASVGSSSQVGSLDGVKRIDATGKWLIPGLTDMHAHVLNDRMVRLALQGALHLTGDAGRLVPDGTIRTEDVLTPFLINGVLQVVSLQAMSESIGQRVEVNAGRVLGPHLVLAAMIDGSPPMWPVGMTRVATTPEDGRQAVRDAAAEGYDLIKVYSRLDLKTFSAIVAESRRLELRVVGHLPDRGKGLTSKLFQPGFDLVAHAEEFAQQTARPSLADIPRYVEMAKRNGTWLTATLTLDDRLLEETSHPQTLRTRRELGFLLPEFRDAVVNHNPFVAQASPERIRRLQQLIDFNQALVRAFVAAGVPVLAGTDAPVPGIVPGFALHDELEALVKAGLTTRQALEGATRLPCEWLRLARECGTVEAGKRADLVLLDGDPLAEIGNTRRIAAVVLGGRYLPRTMLDARGEDLLRRYGGRTSH